MLDDKLKAILDKIDRASVPEEQKLELYDTLQDSLFSIIGPILAKYIPDSRVDELAQAEGSAAMALYTD